MLASTDCRTGVTRRGGRLRPRSMSARYVITGMGVMSSLGLDADSTWQGVSQGRSGIAPIRAFDASALPTRIAGELPGFDAKVHVDKSMRKSLRMMARTLQLAVAIAHKAM